MNEQSEDYTNNPPRDAHPGAVWGAYRLDSDGWWRLNTGIPPGELVRLNPGLLK